MITFTVEGTARPQGSKRHVGGGRMIESSKHVGAWRDFVRLKAAQEMSKWPVAEGPVSVDIQFYFDRPKKHYNSKGLRADAPDKHTTKPDIDKLLRAVLDAMTGIVFKDDSQVQQVVMLKWYGTAAKTIVTVRGNKT